MPSVKYFRILIVEDESLIGWSLANALRKAGYESEVVECGEEAVQKLNRGNYHLVISDIQLPHMDGFDLADRVKSISKNTPVIIVSAREDLGRRERESETHIDYYLEKPFNVKEMLELVHDILEPAGSENFPPIGS